MQLIPILIAAVLGLLALAFVLHPLYRHRLARKGDGVRKIFAWVTGRGQAIYLSPRQGPPTMATKRLPS